MRFYILCLTICISFQINGQTEFSDSIHLDIIRNSDNDSLVGWAYLQMAKKIYKDEPVLSEAYIDSAEMQSEYIKHRGPRANVKFAKGKLLKSKKDDSSAMIVLQEAISEFRALSNDSMIGQTYFQIGSVQINLGELDAANESFINAFKIAEDRQDTAAIAVNLNALGVINRKVGNYDKSLNYYQQALAIFRSQGNKNGESSCLLNMAIIEKQQDRFDNSLRLYQEALAVAESEEKRNEGLFAYIYGNMSAMYYDQNKIQESIYYGEKALKIREKSATNLELSNSYVGLAANHQRIKNHSKAEDYLAKAENYAEGNPEILLMIKRTYSNIARDRNNYKEAFYYLDESKSLSDSVYNLKKTKQIDQLNTEFETERKEAEITKLELEDKLKETQIKQQRLLLGGTGIGLVGLSFLLFRLFSQNKKINSQNSIISQSLDEKELLLKEIHHRVKNNLQVISSLLGMQSRGIEDQLAKDAIKESRSRVHSMSLIHQDLYKHDNLSGIKVQSYLHKLCHDLFNTYDISDGRISLLTDIDNIQLDVDSVIPIGLIVNELMTNSLKYGFPNNRKGDIKVSLKLMEDVLQLIVSDNGIGLDQSNLESKIDTFGHKLIRAFKQKLDAQVHIESVDGTTITLDINNFILKN